MKGPSGRLKYHARRYWACPRCSALRRTGGEIVNFQCPECLATYPNEKCWMHLIESRTLVPIQGLKSPLSPTIPEPNNAPTSKPTNE